MELIVSLHKRAFVVIDRTHLLIVIAAQFIDMPNCETSIRQGNIPSLLLTVFDNKIFRCLIRIGIDKETVISRWNRECSRCDCRHLIGPTRLIFEIGANLDGVFAVAAPIGHKTKVSVSLRLIPIIIKVREVAKHVTIFMAVSVEG